MAGGKEAGSDSLDRLRTPEGTVRIPDDLCVQHCLATVFLEEGEAIEGACLVIS